MNIKSSEDGGATRVQSSIDSNDGAASRPMTAVDRHKRRQMNASYFYNDKGYNSVRRFEEQTAFETEMFNGIHPGKPLHGEGANELRFSMPDDFDASHYLTSNKKVKTMNNFDLEPVKETLKEFNKTVYYSSGGDYDKAHHRVLVEPKMLIGMHKFKQ